MLSNALWISSLIALGIGCVHALYVYRREIGEFRAVLGQNSLAIRLRAVYYALWTLMLWLLLGASVVLSWAVALVPYLVAKALGNARAPRAEARPDAGVST